MRINCVSNQNFTAEFSPEIRKILEVKLANELALNPDKEKELDAVMFRLRYSYFPDDTYVKAVSSNNEESMFGRLKLKSTISTKARILSNLKNTSIWEIENNVKKMAVKKGEFYNTIGNAAVKAKKIMDKY